MLNIDAEKIAVSPAASNGITRNQQLTKLWEKALIDNSTSFQERSMLSNAEIPKTVPNSRIADEQQSKFPSLDGRSFEPVIAARRLDGGGATTSASTESDIGKIAVVGRSTSSNLLQATPMTNTISVDRYTSSIHRSNFVSQTTTNYNSPTTTPANFLVVTHEKEVQVWLRSKHSNSGLDILKRLRTSFSSVGLQLVSMTINGENIYTKNSKSHVLGADQEKLNTANYKFNQVM